MNPNLDRQLARLRTRLAKTPLPGFFAWWGSQLLACLPARWRGFLSERSEALLLDLRGEEVVVWREHGEAMREYARIRRDLPAETQAAEFQRLRTAIDDPAVRTVFCIPAERVLTRTLSLPSAAEDNLRQVLSFEMDRQTPFKADQVYFDSRVLGHDASGRNAQIELVLIPRGQLDQELGALPAGAAELDGVDSWCGAPGAGRRHANLLPPDRRARRRNLRTPLNLGLAALALILLVVNMNESLANRAAAVDAMRVEVEKANSDAKQVAALKKTLADSIAGANFLTDRKRKQPLTVALIDDLSRRLPLDAYLERLQIENKQVQLQGQAQEAAKLIAVLGASPCLGNPGFQGQVQPDPRTGKERFQISAELKECSPVPAAAAAASVASPPAAKASSGSSPAGQPVPAAPPATDPAAAKAARGLAVRVPRQGPRPRPSRPRRRSMAASRFQPKDGRFLAVVLLLTVLMLIYLIGVHWWFVAPHLQLATDMQDLREQQLRFRQTTAEKPEIEKRLAEVKSYEQGNQAFLAESDPNAASAALIQRLKQAMSEHAKNEARCQNVGTQSFNSGEEELYKRVTVQARLKCDLEPLAAILYDLENGKPYLFVDQVMIYRQQTYRPPGSKVLETPLDVRFNLSGYLRQPGGKNK